MQFLSGFRAELDLLKAASLFDYSQGIARHDSPCRARRRARREDQASCSGSVISRAWQRCSTA